MPPRPLRSRASRTAALLARAPRIAATLLALRRGACTFASVNLLNRCNQACPMCAVHAAEDEQLSLEDLERTARALAARGVRVLELSGGEPFLRRDLPDVLAMLDRVGLLFSFNTNGTAVTDGGLAALASARGLVQVAVSLDSLDPARYALLRGRDLLPQALRGLERLVAAGLPAPVKLNFAMSRHNAGETGALLELAAGRGLFLSVFPVNQGPGSHRSDGPTFAASDAERETMARRFDGLARLRRRGAPLWEPSAFYRAAARFLRREPLPACGAGRLYLDVRADGGVAPCVDLPAVARIADLERDEGWAALAAADGAARACRETTPCCYTCTVNLAETARHPVAYALETARLLLLPRRAAGWARALAAEEGA